MLSLSLTKMNINLISSKIVAILFRFPAAGISFSKLPTLPKDHEGDEEKVRDLPQYDGDLQSKFESLSLHYLLKTVLL